MLPIIEKETEGIEIYPRKHNPTKHQTSSHLFTSLCMIIEEDE